MNCAERLVALFGSQAEVARRFRLDRAVVNNWVKSGYVPARWAMEIEHVTGGAISALDILNEANARKPIRLKSRPDGEVFFGSALLGSDTMNSYAPAKRISSFHPPQRTLMGPGPTEIHPRVLTTMSQPAIGYLDPIFVEMMEELKSLLRYAYQTKNQLTFPVSATGTAPLSYQWFKGGTNLINGATNNYYSILPVGTNDAGFYRVLVANPFGFVFSSNATLTVITSTNQPPTTNMLF